MNIKKQIIVKHGIQLKLSKIFKCTPAYVSQALKGKRINGNAAKIRHTALKEYNGYETSVNTKIKKT